MVDWFQCDHNQIYQIAIDLILLLRFQNNIAYCLSLLAPLNRDPIIARISWN